MSTTTTTRQASVDEIATEMDRRGAVIEQLEARLAHIDGINAGAIDNLRHSQRQLDADGIEVGVSRQALCEVLAGMEAALSAPALRAAPVDVAALVERLRSQADALDDAIARRTYLVDHARGLVLRSFEAATLIEALASRSPNETLERAAEEVNGVDPELLKGKTERFVSIYCAARVDAAAAIRSMKEPE